MFFFDQYIAGSDYTAETVTVNFPSGETQAVIPLTISNDDVYEGDEQFTVRLRDTNMAGVTITLDEASICIIDDDSKLRMLYYSSCLLVVRCFGMNHTHSRNH